jgi:uncharacterized protein YukE
MSAAALAVSSTPVNNQDMRRSVVVRDRTPFGRFADAGAGARSTVGAMTADASLQQRFGLTVTPENVLGVRAVVLQEAQDLQHMLSTEEERAGLPPLGQDLVSKDMSREFNQATKQLLDRANQHIDSLKALGEELAASARAYGHAESEIKSSFESAARSAASQISPTFLHAAGIGATAARPRAGTFGELLAGGRSD